MPILRVLIIDDQPSILMLVQALFERTFGGVQVFTSGSAADGLRLLEQQPFDLVLSDVSMPGGDGFSVLEGAKRRWPKLPVILMSGTMLTKEAESKGADAFLLKPFNLQEFQGMVTDVLVRGQEPDSHLNQDYKVSKTSHHQRQ